jgi:hypothetical protein
MASSFMGGQPPGRFSTPPGASKPNFRAGQAGRLAAHYPFPDFNAQVVELVDTHV